MEFHQRHCTPCRGGVPPLTAAEAGRFAPLVPDWLVEDRATRLVRAVAFPDYAQALAFVNAISAVAEAEGHHPDIRFGWGYVTVSLHTHAIGGLHENDFLLAAKFDRLVSEASREPPALATGSAGTSPADRPDRPAQDTNGQGANGKLA